MSTTIDCGEGRHAPTCVGSGDETYLIPQMAGEHFICMCWCHDTPVSQKSVTRTDNNYAKVLWMPEDDPNY